MDGFDVLKQLRKDEKFLHVPVIMSTTSFYDRDIAQAKSLGALGYVTKPIDLSKLKLALEKIHTVKLQEIEEGFVLTRAA
jgi:two-component system chemotaxis response regulator CheY